MKYLKETSPKTLDTGKESSIFLSSPTVTARPCVFSVGKYASTLVCEKQPAEAKRTLLNPVASPDLK